MKTSYSVPMPKNRVKIVELAEAIIEKHQADGNNSKLTNAEMEQMTALTEEARAQLDEWLHHVNRATVVRGHLDFLLGIKNEQNSFTPNTLLNHLRTSRDVLAGVFRHTVKKLIEWGFTVHTSTHIAGGRRTYETNKPEEKSTDIRIDGDGVDGIKPNNPPGSKPDEGEADGVMA